MCFHVLNIAHWAVKRQCVILGAKWEPFNCRGPFLKSFSFFTSVNLIFRIRLLAISLTEMQSLIDHFVAGFVFFLKVPRAFFMNLPVEDTITPVSTPY